MARFAIMRTRFQPYHVGHEWAIKTFFDFVAADSERYAFGAEKLVLGIVDPVINMIQPIKQSRPRFRSEFNPFSDWDVTNMTHIMVCGRGNNRCKDIIRARIPSFATLAFEGKPKITDIKLFLERLPLAEVDENVWFFPIFDREDVDDIIDLWDLAKKGHLPLIPTIVLHHEKFCYDLVEDRNPNRKIGIHAAAYAEMQRIKLNNNIGEKPILPAEIVDYLAKLPNEFNNRLANDRGRISSNRRYNFWRDDCFEFLSTTEVYEKLYEGFRETFEDASKNLWDKKVIFLPPEKDSIEFTMALSWCLEKIRGLIEIERYQKEFGVYEHIIQFAILPTVERCKQVAQELDAAITNLEDKNRSTNQTLKAIRNKLYGIYASNSLEGPKA